jgi:hypothetical protein
MLKHVYEIFALNSVSLSLEQINATEPITKYKMSGADKVLSIAKNWNIR